MKTWHYESAFVALILALTVIITGNYNTADILCAFAVWITFMHGQVADRMQEQQAYLIKPSVSCFKWSNRYFLVKEFIWIVFFFMTKHYSAIAGAGLFFLYPFWRKWWRNYQRIKPYRKLYKRYVKGKQDTEAYKAAFEKAKEKKAYLWDDDYEHIKITSEDLVKSLLYDGYITTSEAVAMLSMDEIGRMRKINEVMKREKP